MNWLVLALISVISVSVATLLQRKLMKEDNSDPVGYAIVFQFILGFMVLASAILLGRFTPPDLNTLTVFQFLLSAILWTGATVFGFHAIKRLSAGEVTILTSSGAVVSIILSIFILGESISLKVVIGTLLVLTSILIVNSEKLSFKSKRGILFALLSALCAGAAVVNDASILTNYEVFSYVAIMSILPGIILILFFPKKLSKSKELLQSKTILLMLVFTSFYSLQAVTYYLAYQNGGDISHLSPITKSSIILTVILGVIFLNERKNLAKKLLATFVVTIGVILLG